MLSFRLFTGFNRIWQRLPKVCLPLSLAFIRHCFSLPLTLVISEVISRTVYKGIGGVWAAISQQTPCNGRMGDFFFTANRVIRHIWVCFYKFDVLFQMVQVAWCCGPVLEWEGEIEGKGQMEKKPKDCASEEMFVWLVVSQPGGRYLGPCTVRVVFTVASVHVDTQIHVIIQYVHPSGFAGGFAHHTPLLSLLSSSDTAHDGRVVQTLLQLAGLWRAS